MRIYLVNALEFECGRLFCKLLDLPMPTLELDCALKEIGGDRRYLLVDYESGCLIQCCRFDDVISLNEMAAGRS